ncbi:MAG TPA: ABC transporter ATP-binding protein [Candidatus Xenobia bacterium]|jgi:ATP-binding cassette subfamily B protein
MNRWRRVIEQYRRVGGLMRGQTGKSVLGLLAIMPVQAIAPLLSAGLMKLIFDSLAHGAGLHDITWFRHEVLLLAAFCGLNLIVAVLNVANGWLTELQSIRVTDRVEALIQAKAVALDLASFEDPQFHDALHRAQFEARYRVSEYVGLLARLICSFVSAAILLAFLLRFQPGLVLILAAALGPGIAVSLRIASSLNDISLRDTPLRRQGSYLHLVLCAAECAKEVRLFGLGRTFQARADALRARLAASRLRMARLRSTRDLFTQATWGVAMLGASSWVAWETVQGAISLGGLVMYVQLLLKGSEYLKAVQASLAGLRENSLVLDRLFEFLAFEPRMAAPSQPVPVTPLETGLAFEGISFRYPQSDRLALDNVSLWVPAGAKVALVGENGSGKSTLVKLLCRLYDTGGGRITWDATDVRDFDPAEMRRHVSVVFQDFVRYHMTARENIWLGNVDLDLQDPCIEQAAQAAGAETVVQSLDRQYETPLGKMLFDGGEDLSQGEWQRIALARAMVRATPLVVLDEPTSALDAVAEADFFTRFMHLAGRRTVIFVSHRFSTVRMADHIVVMDAGRVIEQGNHADLMARQGRYAHMFELQATRYR